MKVPKPGGKVLFREVQQFRQWWLWAILLSGSLIPVILVAVLLPQDKNISAGEVVLVIAVVGGTSLINLLAFYLTKLETIVTDEGIFYRWWPYRRQYTQLAWAAISTVTVRRYPHLKYGYHTNREFGKVHNIDGNRGVQLELADGKRVYLGTQKLSAFQHALEQHKPVAMQTK